MTTLEKVFSLLKTTNKGDYVIEREIGLKRGCIANWRLDRGKPSADALTKIADYFNVSVDYLLGRTESPNPISAPNVFQTYSENEIYSFPIIGTISAGYNGLADEEYTGEDIVVPPHLIKTHNPNDYFVLQVKGNSMYPLLEDGDKVLVRRCNTVDSGTIAAVGYNGSEVTVKKVEYVNGEDWLRLTPRNPEYPVKTIRGSDLDQCHIYCEIVYLFRDKIIF